MAFISKTPKPPYYAVIFTSINADVDHAEHVAMSRRMVELAGPMMVSWALNLQETLMARVCRRSIGKTPI